MPELTSQLQQNSQSESEECSPLSTRCHPLHEILQVMDLESQQVFARILLQPRSAIKMLEQETRKSPTIVCERT
jgi:hypothetical protein